MKKHSYCNQYEVAAWSLEAISVCDLDGTLIITAFADDEYVIVESCDNDEATVSPIGNKSSREIGQNISIDCGNLADARIIANLEDWTAAMSSEETPEWVREAIDKVLGDIIFDSTIKADFELPEELLPLLQSYLEHGIFEFHEDPDQAGEEAHEWDYLCQFGADNVSQVVDFCRRWMTRWQMPAVDHVRENMQYYGVPTP